MKITLYLSTKPGQDAIKGRELAIGNALKAGFEKHGDTVEILPTEKFGRPDWESQLAVVIGIKGHSKKISEEYRRGGRHAMLIDKSYIARTEYLRVSVGGFQPPYAHAQKRPHDRWEKIAREFRLEPKPRRTGVGDYVIYAGSSQKYCDWHQLGDATDFARSICHAINKTIGKADLNVKPRLLYRPKPSWVAGHPDDAKPVSGTEFSGPDVKLDALLPKCHALVTHGSNAAVEAIMAGVPVVIRSEGACAAEPMAELALENLFRPHFPSDRERLQWLADLAYLQFSLAEISDGTMWDITAEHTMKAGHQAWAGMGSLDGVIAQYKAMHESAKMFRGSSIKGHIEAITDLVAAHKPESMLDYGCGKGLQYSEWKVQDNWGGLTPSRYDPGVPGIDQKPAGKFDAVISTDVMEHIPPDHVDAVFGEAINYARKFAFFCIYTQPSRKHLPDGRNAHLTCRPEQWWIDAACRLTGGAVDRVYSVSKPIPGGGFEKFMHTAIRASSGAEVVLTFRGED